MKHIALFIMLILGLGLHVQGQSKYEINAQEYVNAKLVDRNSDQLDLYLMLSLNSNEHRLYNYRFNFYTYKPGQYATETRKLDYADSSFLASKERTHYMLFTFQKKDLNKSITIESFNYLTGQNLINELTLDMSVPLILKDYDGIPTVKSYTPSDTYYVTDSTKLQFFYYDYYFEPALPPMVTKNEAPQKEMKLTSTFTFSKLALLNEQGLYLIQKDTTSSKAFSFRVENDRYPRFTRIDELIEPLIYITEPEEFDSLLTIENDKKEFDRFWLTLVEDPQRALGVIREFYNRVEAANRMFTTFKQGWKTDMGMIYIVMGKPDRVQKSGDKETWTYRESINLPSRTYQFIRTKSIFSSNHYVLIREKKHALPWYEAIDLIRKGVVD